MLDYLFLAAGLVCLIIGGDILVRGSVGLAEKLNIPPMIIGLTIVAFGTSAPELFISVKAALDNASGIAIGNVVGSNIANVLLVMGLPALIAPMVCDEKNILRNIIVMLGMTVVFMMMMGIDGTISRLDGVILLGLLGAFLWDQYRASQKTGSEAVHDYHEEIESVPANGLVIAALIAGGLIALPFGADLTVDSAVSIAQKWHVSDDVIGLTIVALGTSLPELATSLMAAIRRNGDIALGNVVGSNIFNIGSIMGIAAIISPMQASAKIISTDMWVMLACALIVAGLAHWKVKIGKRVGVTMTLLYLVYVALAFT